MDKKKKIIAITASIAVLVATIGASLGNIGWLQSSVFSVQSQIDTVSWTLSRANTELTNLQNEKQTITTSFEEVNERIKSVRVACLSYRSALKRIAERVLEAENALAPLQNAYNTKVASRDTLQEKFNSNKQTIDNNNKVVIPGIQKEQKKYKSTSAEYKKLATDIVTIKKQNTDLTKENTDPKTGLQKQINTLNTEIKNLSKVGSPLQLAQANLKSANSTQPANNETVACNTYDDTQHQKTWLADQISSIDEQIAQKNDEIRSLLAQLTELSVSLTEARNQEEREKEENIQKAAEIKRIIEEAQKQQAATNAAREKALQECLVEARTITENITIENDTETNGITGDQEGSRDLSVEEKEAECQNTYGPIDTTSTTTGGDGGTTGTTSGTSGDGGTTGGTGDGATAGTLGTGGTTGGDDGDTTGGTGSEIAICGNWITEPPEECDDWNTEGGDFCEADCLAVNKNAGRSCKEGLIRYTVPCGGGAQATVQEKTYDDCSFKIEASGPNGVHSLIQSTAQILAGNWSEKLWVINAACGY